MASVNRNYEIWKWYLFTKFFHISEQLRISETQEIDFFISNINSSTPWTLPPGLPPPPPYVSTSLPPLFPYAWMSCREISLPFGMERQCQCHHLNFRCLYMWRSRSTLAAHCRLGYGLQSTVTCWLYSVLHLNCKPNCRVLFRDGSIKRNTNNEKRMNL
jgi:hypothetical protein